MRRVEGAAGMEKALQLHHQETRMQQMQAGIVNSLSILEGKLLLLLLLLQVARRKEGMVYLADHGPNGSVGRCCRG